MRRFQPYSEEGKLKGVGHRVSITKYCKRYYVTNSTGKHITSKYIVNHYRVRWAIEVLFRSLKQLCHLQDCQGKKTQAQKHYVFMCIRAFITLQDQNEKSLYQAKKTFQQKYLRIKINGNKASEWLHNPCILELKDYVSTVLKKVMNTKDIVLNICNVGEF